MLTPLFDIVQTDEFLFVQIQVPYAKVSEVEVYFEDVEFVFYSKPYFLRLHFPGKIQYVENPQIDFNVEKKLLTVKVPKAQYGEYFEGLDLYSTIMEPRKNKTTSVPLIEVIDGSEIIPENDDDIDWSIEQIPCEELGSIHGDQCGFANSYSYAVFNLKEEVNELFDMKELQINMKKRKEERFKKECNEFSEEHYLTDLYEDEEIQMLYTYEPQWSELYKYIQTSDVGSPDEIIHFTAEEKEKLQKLPKKEYILDKNQEKIAFLGLLDIMFAYAYNKRTTKEENNVESAWTINKLSATLSWLETFSSVQEVVLSFYRRSLIYPLHRSFKLTTLLKDDVKQMFSLGRKYIIKCLLEIRSLFNHSEPRYILNDLFITDYCVWMQSKRCSTPKLIPLLKALENVCPTKEELGLNLAEIENITQLALIAHNSPLTSFSLATPNEKVENADSLAKTYFDNLCHSMEELNIENRQKYEDSTSNVNSQCDFSEYESCSSCSSASDDSSSNTIESDSNTSYSEDTSTSESEEETDSSIDSDDDAHKHLLKKENEEKIR